MSLVSSPFFFSSASTGFYPFEPTGSLRFEDGDSPYLTRTPTTAGNRKTWTFSAWVKRCSETNASLLMAGPSGDSNNFTGIFFIGSSNIIDVQMRSGGSTDLLRLQTSQVFRDFSAWYHLVFVLDLNNATQADRFRIYVNGSRVTDFSTNTNSLNNTQSFDVNNTVPQYISRNSISASDYLDGYMSEIYLIDGTAHDADAFGEFKNGVWVPKDAKGSLTFGTNGFYLPFNSTVTAEGQSTVLYEGTGTERSVEGFGYKPDLVWFKNRGSAENHALFDRVRGANRNIASNATTAEGSIGDTLQAFHNDGVALGDDGNWVVNRSGYEFVAWAWDAGADQTPTGFGCVTYTGSGGRRPVRDVGFKPDLVWLKDRTTAYSNTLFDSIRGDAYLFTDATTAEQTRTDTNFSVENDGFDIGSYLAANKSGDEFVAWCWDAGDGDAASNTDGSITSTVKASDEHGFSIVNYTGTGALGTVGHGLSTAPDFVIRRVYDDSWSWLVYHSALGSNEYLILNTNAAAVDDAGFMNDTDPTSSVMTVNTFGSDNDSGGDAIAYCWTEKSGYSKFTSYTGNGSTSGPTVTLGFRPSWVMIKNTSNSGNWTILDSTRNPAGQFDLNLYANNSDSEATQVRFETTSTGFTIKTDTSFVNTSGDTYIVVAFAGGLDTIAPVNTDGDIDSRVKASDDTGFSIVRYQGSGTDGDTVGHGLSSAPDWIVIKQLNGTQQWPVFHSSASATAGAYLLLNKTDAVATDGSMFDNTDPTSSVFTVTDASGDTNRSGDDYIAYCWTATTGKSAFGSYTGNGSATGPEITGLGFEPSLIIIKQTSASGNGFNIFDNYRHPNNPNPDALFANAATAETTNSDNQLDFNSDGFQLKGTGASVNANNETYIYMAFADGRDASFFHDESGQDNNFEPENLQNYDVVPDSPTNNFATLNPLQKIAGTLSEGNLEYDGDNSVASTIAVSSGKWYCEARADSFSSDQFHIGFFNVDGAAFTASNARGASSSSFVMKSNGQKRTNGTSSSYGSSFSTSDIIGMALDLDGGTLEFFINGTSQGDAFTSLSGNFVLEVGGPGASIGATLNFGQDDSFAGTVTPGGYTDANERGSFKYPVPDGFLSLCSLNLPDPVIDPASDDLPEDYFNTVTYSGNNTQLAVTGVGFQPDLTWIKKRSGIASHAWQDAVRGSFRYFSTNNDAGENTDSGSDWFRSFDSDGFTVSKTRSSDSVATTEWNNSGDTYVSWNWLAGGTAVSNTDGATTSSVSANTKAGFSIVTYTGSDAGGGGATTVGHGLDSAPELIITKNRDNTSDWRTYSSVTGNGNALLLNSTAASGSTSSWNSTSPTSTVFSSNIYDGDEIVAYCFHSVEGYSKVGSYTGNGSSDGPFVHCGFRPAWVMVKRTDSTSNWLILDNRREGYNPDQDGLDANGTGAEGTAEQSDFLSNGFKVRNNSSGSNASGGSFIFIAFAEMPFKYAQAR